MKDKTKVALIFAAFVIALVAGGVALATHKGPKPAPTTEQKLQKFLDANVTDRVQHIEVVSCKDVGRQTVGGVTYDPLYACPTTLLLKNGQGGCVGVLAAGTSDGQVVVVANPEAIDPKLCNG